MYEEDNTLDERTMIGQRIYDLRVDRDIQQGELAAAVKLNQSVLNRIEKGTRAARDREVRDIALYFGISADDLLGIPHQPGGIVLSPVERRIIERFRCLDHRGKSMIRHAVENEYDYLLDEREAAKEREKGPSSKDEDSPF